MVPTAVKTPKIVKKARKNGLFYWVINQLVILSLCNHPDLAVRMTVTGLKKTQY